MFRVVSFLSHPSWNDLIVGAPFYFDRVALRGGAVYVFMNENGSFQSTCTMMLTGEAFSGFGTAVAAIGDVNQDGFQGVTFNLSFVSHFVWKIRSLIKLSLRIICGGFLVHCARKTQCRNSILVRNSKTFFS